MGHLSHRSKVSVSALLIALASIFLSVALASASTVSDTANDPTGFLDSLYFYKDKNNSLSFEAIQNGEAVAWEKADTTAFNFGFEQSPVWVRFTLPRNHAAEDLLFEVSNPKFNRVDVWVASSQPPYTLAQRYQVDGMAPISTRPFHSRHFVFPITPSAEEDRTIYLRVQTNYQLRIPLYLWTPDQFRQNDTASTLFQGFYFGVVIIMAIYNLCIYFYVRDKSYGTYALFILFLAGFVATERGLMAEYVWPESPSLDFQMVLLFTALGAGISVPFTSYFLSLDTYAPKIARAYRYFFGLWMFIAALALIAPGTWLLFVVVMVLIPGGTSLFVVGVLMWRKGVPAAPYFTVAWAIMVAAATFYDSYLLGLFPVSIITEYSLQVGNMLEVTLLSLGLASRIKTLDQEKHAATLLSKAKGDFLATMSHEIRTPMNGILGMAELLRDTKLNTQQMNYLNTILNSGQTLLTVLNDILDYSKIEAGKFELESVNYDFRTLLNEATAIFSVKAKEKKLHYNTYVSAHVPRTLHGDPVRVKQVITNLINNAFKFTKEGSIQVRVTRPNRDQILIEVIDSGIGIANEKLGSIFEKFTQADSSTSRQFGGTGLGLSISKRFIQAMGGDIGVTSRLGAGSTFWFLLPLREAVEYGETEVLPEQPLPSLVISPDQQFVAQLKEYAPSWHVQFDEVASIQQALEKTAGTDKAYAMLLIDQHCADFSETLVSELANQAGPRATRMLLLLETGTPRAAFEQLQPPPWFEEFPICMHRLHQRLINREQTNEVAVEAPALPDLSPLQVLVVDDNQVNGMVVTGYLRKLGIQPTVVDSGQAALDKVFSALAPFDLILMDCEMPEIDGYEATERIREWERTQQKQRTPICALSAHAMESYREKCFTAGMDDFLSKPINFDHLRSKLTNLSQAAGKP